MRGKRYSKNLRLNKNKAACIQAMMALDSELSILPQSVAIGFDSAFGLDTNLNNFLKSNFSLDLSAYENGEQAEKDLLEGKYDENNPVLSLEHGDLIADQIAAYATVSRQIREAFDVRLDEQLSIDALLPLSADYHAPKTYFAPVFKGDSDDAYEGLHIQMEVRNPMMPISNTDVYAAENKTTEIKDVTATIFEHNEPIGCLDATLLTMPDIAVFGQHDHSHALKGDDFKNDIALVYDIEKHSPDLVSVTHALIRSAKQELPNDQSRKSSLMRKFVLTDEGDHKNGMLFLNSVDISSHRKDIFIDVVETLGTIFSDHGRYDMDCYGTVDGYNTLIWNALSHSPDILTKIDEANSNWKLGGLSAIVASEGYQWWHEALSKHQPFENGDLSDAKLLVEESNQGLVSTENESSTILGNGIEDILMKASVVEDNKMTFH